MKRFYEKVSVSEGGPPFALLLDGRPVLTPKHHRLEVPTQALAAAIAEEWKAQGERVIPATMPMTRLAYTAIDFVAMDPSSTIADIVAYAGSDLLCYRAEAPIGLVAMQAKSWDPILDWAASAFGLKFETTVGLMPCDQPASTLDRLRQLLLQLSPFRLMAFHSITTLTGSAILALALSDRAADEDSIWRAAHVDEDWQISQWGEDQEAVERRARQANEMAAASRLLRLLEPGSPAP